MSLRALRRPQPRRVLAGGAAVLLACGAATIAGSAAPAWASSSPCADGSTPDLLSTVVCNAAGNYTLTVPAGTTSVATDLVGAGGGAGYPARQHIGGNAAEVAGTLTLPAGTAYLYVIVGAAGTGDNHGTSSGGGASAVLAEDSGHLLLAKLAIAGGGGGGAYNGDGGGAGSPGTSDNAQAVSGPGQAGTGATGGAGGTGNYAPGTAGDSNNPGALTVASGGTGGAVPGGARGGGGAGGYGGGGGGGGSRGSILSSNVAGGGGGSSLASAYLGSASILLKAGTGGIQLPGLVAGDGATGTVTLTFDGLAVPGTPIGVSATAGDGQASVSFTAPASDGGSSITSYTVTSSPGGKTATCPGSPCVVTGLTDGTSYTFTVHATNENGDSPESVASAAVTPATAPGAPTEVSATAGDGQASVSFTAPASDGGSSITSYTVTSSPGGKTATCPGSPCVVTGLTNGTAYTFTVTATNDVGNSVASSSSAAVTPVGAPSAPTGVAATAGAGQASVSFTAPASDGGSPITSYTVTSSPGGLTATCPGSPCVVTGLTDGASYTFTVHATNENGDSPESAASAAVTPATAPGAPTEVSATAGDGQASVSFTAPASDGGSPITSYTVTSSPGGKTATCPGSPCVVTGLTNGTAYTFTVTATNGAGNSDASSSSEPTTPASVPLAPSSLTVTPGDGGISVSFPVPANGGASITGYQISTDGGLTWTSLSVMVTDATAAGAITGLLNGETYLVAVRAVNSAGPGESSPTRMVTPATTPDAPTAVSAIRGNGSAEVSFTAPDNNGGALISDYTVTSSPGDLTATCPGSPCQVDGLTNGTSYTFTVHATNSAGSSVESDPSNSVTPATVPTVPRSVRATRGNQQIVIDFTAPASGGGSAITRYEVSTDGGSSWQTLQTTDTAGQLTGTVTGLTNGTTYDVRVRAVNDVGAGLPSVAESVTPATTPGVPTDVTAVAGRGSAMVSFVPSPDSGGAEVISYTVTSAPGGITATCGSSPCVIGGLTDGTSYTFTVHATNALGNSAESAASAAVTPLSPPSQVGPITGTTTETTATLAFPVPADGGSPIAGYEYSTDGGLTWSPLGSTTTDGVVTATITGLATGTRFAIVVRAANAKGAGGSSTTVTVVTLPSAPQGIRAVAGTSSVVVSWQRSTTASVTGYTVFAHPGPATCTASATQSSCVIGATAGVEYTYSVVAHVPGAESAAVQSTGRTAAAPTLPDVVPLDAPTTLTATGGALGTVRPGQRVTLSGAGFLAFSSVVIGFYGSPVTVGSVVTDGDGRFVEIVTIPSGARLGDDNLVAVGVDPSGATYRIRLAVHVAAATSSGSTSSGSTSSGSTSSGSTSSGSGSFASTSDTGSGSLASTGAAPLRFTLWGLLIMGVGVALTVSGRRRVRTGGQRR